MTLLDLFTEIEFRPFKSKLNILFKISKKGVFLGASWPIQCGQVMHGSEIREEFTQWPPTIAIFSTDIGYRKTDWTLIHACKSVGVPEANTIYVGNKEGTDMAACARAGILGVLLAEKIKPTDPCKPATATSLT